MAIEFKRIGAAVTLCLLAAAGIAAGAPFEALPIRHVFLIVLENKSYLGYLPLKPPGSLSPKDVASTGGGAHTLLRDRAFEPG